MGVESAVDNCSSADSIARSPGHKSIDHFQSDLILICMDMVNEKHSGALIECIKNCVAGRSKEIAVTSSRLEDPK